MPPFAVLARVEASVERFRARMLELVPAWLPGRDALIAEQVEAYRKEIVEFGTGCYQDAWIARDDIANEPIFNI